MKKRIKIKTQQKLVGIKINFFFIIACVVVGKRKTDELAFFNQEIEQSLIGILYRNFFKPLALALSGGGGVSCFS